MPANVLTFILIGSGALAGAGLGYLAFLGARAIFRESRQTARDAGCREGAATTRAVLRMIVWASFFGIYYFFLFFLGRSIGWWAALPALVGLAAMIWGVLEADRLLTVRPEAVRQQFGIAATLTALIAGFVSVIWWAAQAA
jgi:hypothetical protein